MDKRRYWNLAYCSLVNTWLEMRFTECQLTLIFWSSSTKDLTWSISDKEMLEIHEILHSIFDCFVISNYFYGNFDGHQSSECMYSMQIYKQCSVWFVNENEWCRITTELSYRKNEYEHTRLEFYCTEMNCQPMFVCKEQWPRVDN